MRKKTRSSLRWFTIPFIFSLSLIACNLTNLLSESTPTPAQGDSITASVGVDGGEINGPDGVKLIIPEGAVPGEISISISRTDDPPQPPPDSLSTGTAYKITVPAGTRFLFPIEVILPLDRQEGLDDDNYVVYRWDGNEWHYMGGIIKGDQISVMANEFSTLQIGGMLNYHAPVLFLNYSGNKAYVFPWTWDTTDPLRLGYGYTFTGRTGIFGDGVTWGLHNLPWATYFSWCIQWDEWTQPVWDLHGGGFWSEYIGTYHMFLNYPITINENSSNDGSNFDTMTRVEFVLTDRIDGFCGNPPGQVPTTPTDTPGSTLTPESTFTPTSEGLQPGNTPTITPTSTETIEITSETPTTTETSSPQVSVDMIYGDARNFTDPPDLVAYANTDHTAPPEGVTIHAECGSGGCWRYYQWIAFGSSSTYVEAIYGQPTTSIGVQFWGDTNDGWARVLVDGQEVWVGNTHGEDSNWPGGAFVRYLNISGLEKSVHTIRVEGMSQGDVTLYYFGFGPTSE
jgi:hypothetical protein